MTNELRQALKAIHNTLKGIVLMLMLIGIILSGAVHLNADTMSQYTFIAHAVIFAIAAGIAVNRSID